MNNHIPEYRKSEVRNLIKGRQRRERREQREQGAKKLEFASIETIAGARVPLQWRQKRSLALIVELRQQMVQDFSVLVAKFENIIRELKALAARNTEEAKEFRTEYEQIMRNCGYSEYSVYRSAEAIAKRCRANDHSKDIANEW